MKKRILFVCSGNICRSPSAEAVFKAKVENEGLYTLFDIDSAGTGAWHVGQSADSRMKRHAKKRGYSLTSIARQFKPEKILPGLTLLLPWMMRMLPI
jgi:protein-tyrosine phosphatase